MTANRRPREKTRELTTGRTGAEIKEHLHEILDLGSTWYKRWYFLARVEEEIARAVRYQYPLAIVSFRVRDAGEEYSETRRDLNALLAWFASDRLRVTDMPGVLSSAEAEYAVLLPYSDGDGAESFAKRLVGELRDFPLLVSIASYPSDGKTADELIENGRVLDDKMPENLIPFLERKRAREYRQAAQLR